MLLLIAMLLAPPVAPCFTHERTGVAFAVAPAGYVCSGPRVLDAARDEVSIGYKAVEPDRTFTVSAYVYQKALPCCSPDGTVQEHLEEVKTAVASRYEGLTCQSWAAPGRPAMTGLRCSGRSPGLGPDTYVTYVGLQELSGWWLKVRATARADEQERSEEALRVLLAGIEVGGTGRAH
jgi:hypothetical protein